MTAAAADLEFYEGPAWKEFFGRPGFAAMRMEAKRLVGNYVVSNREQFGVMEICITPSAELKQLWVFYYRRKGWPDRVSLLDCRETHFTEARRAYYQEVFGES